MPHPLLPLALLHIALLLAATLLPAALRAEARTFDERITSEIVIIEQALFHEQEEAPAGLSGTGTLVRLPHRWGFQDRPAYDSAGWYVVGIHLTESPRQAISVLLPKVSMNGDLWLNGKLVAGKGSMETPLARHRNTSLLFDVPASAWRPGLNHLMVRVKSRVQYSGALGPVLMGPQPLLAADQYRRVFWGTTLRNFTSSYAVALGIFVLLIWSRERTQTHYAAFALGTILVGVANLLTWMIDVPLSNDTWQRLINIIFDTGHTALLLFGLRIANLHRTPLGKLLIAATAVIVATQIFLPDRWYMAPYAAYGLMLALSGIVVLVGMLIALHRQSSPDKWILGPALACTAVCGLHDALYLAGYVPITHFYVLPYALTLLLSAIAWLIAGEYMRAHRDLHAMSKDLAIKLKIRESELQATFSQLAESSRELAVTAERARILRDMHDGVGAHLTTAIRQLQSGRASPKAIEDSLRISLDSLKLSIDSMNITAGDVAGLLASFRYRMQPRLEEMGVGLHWHMEALPDWPIGTQEAMRQLQYILLEAWSNSLQHSRAATLGLEARHHQGTIEIVLWDDGIGIQGEPRNGMKNMMERATLIGLNLRVEPGRPGTRVILEIPQVDEKGNAVIQTQS